MIKQMPKYECYKDSGEDWIGDVPSHWEVVPIRSIFKFRNEKNDPIITDNILSLSIAHGVTEYSEEGRGGNKRKDDLSAYKITRPGDIVMNSMNVIVGAVGLSKYFGAISPVYYALYTEHDEADINYYEKVFQNESFQRGLLKFGKGILIKLSGTGKLNTIRMKVSTDDLKTLNFPKPPHNEQIAISNYLDGKTAQIDEAIAIKQKQIELLKERKQIIIQQAVTQGLNPDAPMKDSGVDWIGTIPEHWEVRRSKFLFTQRKEKAWKDDVQLSATQKFGVIPQDEYEARTGARVVKIQFHLDKRKHVEKDDFVISMRSFQGGLERAWSRGCIRSSYVILRPLEPIDPNFYGYLLKLPMYIKALQRTASFIRDGQDLNFDNFSQVDLFIPPLEEQKAIADYVRGFMESSDDGISLMEEQIAKLKEYKTTLINSAVTGKIKVTELA
ncbi:restriction endonuclease subunit S [Vibrio vulnificus]|uniref:restriction endonuclease subunit S n=1 Tax=Vibrio vulnificus TaxID=672 RepID=UPI00287A3FCE|nr:restriction endonuclease subunit S [Vibrio vulnificus]MDS1863948.1 restriction endonuclease subunit S [Vibrio vulnificus]